MNAVKSFEHRNTDFVRKAGRDTSLLRLSKQWFEKANSYEYSYHFRWLGRPIIQYPQDILAVQELVWETRPDLIIETGVAHGGSLILSASLLAMLDVCDREAGKTPPPRRVIGIDIDIRPHNRRAIEAHPMSRRIDLIEGSSVSTEVVETVQQRSKRFKKILVFLDSNHTHDHVLAELRAYAPLVSKGSYCVVFDTVIEHLPKAMFPNRPWGPGNNPKTAVKTYLSELKKTPSRRRDNHPLRFAIDTSIDDKLLISVAPNGYLKRL